MDEDVTLKDSKKTTVGILLTVIFVSIVLVGAVGYLVEPEEIPEDSIFNSNPEVQQDQGKSGLADLIWEPEPDSEVLSPPPSRTNNIQGIPLEFTDSQKAIDMPQSVVEMAKFLSGKDISPDDLSILMDYAVHQERNNFDETIDIKARMIMEKLLD